MKRSLLHALYLLALSFGCGLIHHAVVGVPAASASSEPSSGIVTVGLEEGQRLMAEDFALAIDLGEPESFARQHLPGAFNVPGSAFMREGWPEAAMFLDPAQAVLIYCSEGCNVALEVATLFLQRGFEVVHVLGPGLQGWIRAGLPTEAS